MPRPKGLNYDRPTSCKKCGMGFAPTGPDSEDDPLMQIATAKSREEVLNITECGKKKKCPVVAWAGF